MNDDREKLTPEIEEHLHTVTESSGLAAGEESFRLIKSNWLQKRDLFQSQTKALHMSTLDSLAQNDGRGVLLLSWSGSLISLGAAGESGRAFEYASIKLRSDVPDIVKTEGVTIAGDIVLGKPAYFSNCPVNASSNILIIAVCDPSLSLSEQNEIIREATIFLTNGFLKLNKTLGLTAAAAAEDIDHFTMRSMTAYTARRNKLSQSQVREVIDDFLATAETGMLLGERVPLGKIGRLYLKKRAAQKARMGHNPATGEEMLIKAKPETAVPRINFSGRLKEKAEGAVENAED
jgi:nucleoid DNA-binding protein